ncbi:hypothetical protein H4Q26_015457 [Puccinia striiformis f. sp. tritici PST-130]|nr:hypothetical protein H4Q26_015457 [Puccinia striiformis f. sp. tritici PST-130]
MTYVKAQTLSIADQTQILHYPWSYYLIIKHQEATTRSELHHIISIERTKQIVITQKDYFTVQGKITVVSYNNTLKRKN